MKTRVVVLLKVLAAAAAVCMSPGMLPGEEFHVMPGGGTGAGTLADPWSIEYAFSHPSEVQPGDTIWLHGGTYSGGYASYITGIASMPITVRGYPAERPILDGNNDDARSLGTVLAVHGAHVVFRDFEVTSSDSVRPDNGHTNIPQGVTVYDSQNIKLINLVVHDVPGQGIAAWSENTNAEVYGCIIYYNGVNGTFDHGMYVQNRYGTKRIADNIVCHQASHGIHCYGSSAAYLDNLVLEGNTVFEAGSLAGGSGRNILLGGMSIARDPVVNANYTYFLGYNNNSNIGYSAGTVNAQVTNNYFIAGNVAIRLNVDPAAVVTGNFFSGELDPADMPVKYPSNTYVASRPTSGQTVFVRPNQYEPGRANITVYNWSGASTVSVDISAVGLTVGRNYVVRDAQNFFGPPVATGIYNGTPILIPMTGLTTAVPIGTALFHPVHTGLQFGAFVIFDAGDGDKTAPSWTSPKPSFRAPCTMRVTVHK